MASGEDEELAALAGFTVAFFKSDDGLWSVFQKAKKGQWSGDRLLAAARNTKWFKKHNEAQRQAQLLKTSDPAEYKRRISEARTKVSSLSQKTGLARSTKGNTGKFIRQVAEMAFLHGWSDQKIINQLSTYNTVQRRTGSTKFQTIGLVAEGERMIRQLSQDYGIKVSNKTLANMATNFAKGKWDQNFMHDYFTNKAKNTYVGLRDEIRAGMTVREAAEPYFEAMGRIWETNPRDIDLFDNTIRKALTHRDSKGKAGAQPLYEFENTLRQSPRWNQTNNGRESYFGAGHKVLQDMGLMS